MENREDEDRCHCTSIQQTISRNYTRKSESDLQRKLIIFQISLQQSDNNNNKIFNSQLFLFYF